MNKIRIAGAIASKTGITLYLEDGKEMNLPTGTWKTEAILKDAMPALARHEIVEIDLDTFSVETHIEKKTGGLLRFVKEKFSVMKGWLSSEPAGSDTRDKIRNIGISEAVRLAKKQAKAPPAPVTTAVEGEERTVAIVRNSYGGETRIPHVEKLDQQMERAVRTGDYAGFSKFMERLASVIKHRGHSVDELLNFMKRGDLPIADDGSIIAYKVLQSQRGEYFVDCHSQRVVQRLGSHVSMAKNLVDPSRRTQCSTGLHIARRAYLRGFSGNVITMVKVAPEDVIAVPSVEPDKMRAAAYHIVAVLPTEAHALLRANTPMTSNSEAAKMLADVIKGNHIGIIEHVQIGGAHGGDLKVTLVDDAAPAPKEFQNGEAVALDDKLPDTSIKQLRQAVVDAIAEKAMTAPVVEKTPVVDTPIIPEAAMPAILAVNGETAAERRNRVKRQNRAAKSAADHGNIAPIAIKTAAITGDYAAVLNDFAVVAADMKKALPTPDPVKKVAKPKPVTVNQNVAGQLPEKQRLALEMIDAGKSQRQIEKELNISPKTIRKLLKNR